MRRAGHRHDRGNPGRGAEGHHDHRGRQAGRRPRAPLLLPPVAAVAGGVPDVPGGGREGSPKLVPACVTTVADGQVVHVNSAKAEGGPRRACSSSCSSTTRSIARSATRPASASCRTTCSRRGARATPLRRLRQALQPGRGLRARRALRAQPLHPLHPLRPLHGERGRGADARTCPSGATAPTSASPRSSCSTIPGPATSSTSARSDRCSPRTSCTRRAPGTSTRPRASAPAAPRAATSRSTPATTSWSALRPRPESRGQPALHVRHRPDGLSLDEPRRPGRGAAGARWRRGTWRPTGTRRSTAWARCCRGTSGSVVILASGRASHRVARAAAAAGRRPARDRGGPGAARRRGARWPVCRTWRCAASGRRTSPVPSCWATAATGPARSRAAATAALVIVLDAELSADDEAALGQVQGALVVLGTVPSDAPAKRGAGASGHHDGGRERHLRQSGRPGAAVPAGQGASPAWRGRPGGSRARCSPGRGPTPMRPPPAAEAFAHARPDLAPRSPALSYADLGFTGRVLAGAHRGGAAR